MGICTGEYLDPELPTCAGSNGLSEAPVNRNVLFDGSSTSQYSPTFQVAEGESVQLTAWALAGATAQVEKLLLNPQVQLPTIDNGICCDVPPWPTPEILASKAICTWQLTDCQELRYVQASGLYRLFLTDPGAVGQAFVTMERMQRRDHEIPDGLVLGQQ
jgi:hypothetical protein